MDQWSNGAFGGKSRACLTQSGRPAVRLNSVGAVALHLAGREAEQRWQCIAAMALLLAPCPNGVL